MVPKSRFPRPPKKAAPCSCSTGGRDFSAVLSLQHKAAPKFPLVRGFKEMQSFPGSPRGGGRILPCPGVLGLLLVFFLSFWGCRARAGGAAPPRKFGVFELSKSCCSPVPPPRALLGCVTGTGSSSLGVASLGLGFEPSSVPGGAPGAQRAEGRSRALRAPLA